MSFSVCTHCNGKLDEYFSNVLDPESLHSFEIMRCNNCDLEQTWPQPKELSEYYSFQYYGGRHGFTDKYCVWRRINWVSKFLRKKNSRLLDMGCGDGSFLLSAKKKGWHVDGVDSNPNLARSLGLNVRLNLNDFEQETLFDCVTLWHSLEHMRNPEEVLKDIHMLMTKKGLLWIAVPNAGGWQALLFGKKWLHRDVPRHLFHFSPASLRSLLYQNGFKIVKSWHQEFEYDLLGWSQSLLNCMFSKPNIFFKMLTGRKTGVSRLAQMVHGIAGVFFSILALPLVPLSALCRSGGTLIVVAERQDPDIMG